jgi:hypothetical protein
MQQVFGGANTLAVASYTDNLFERSAPGITREADPSVAAA